MEAAINSSTVLMEGPVVPHVLRQSAHWLVKKVVVQAETQSQDPHLRACRCHMNGNTHFEGFLCRCFGGCVIYKASRGFCFPVTSCFQSRFYLADRTNQAFDIYSMVKRWMDEWMDERSLDDNGDTDRSIYIRRLLTWWLDGCTDGRMHWCTNCWWMNLWIAWDKVFFKWHKDWRTDWIEDGYRDGRMGINPQTDVQMIWSMFGWIDERLNHNMGRCTEGRVCYLMTRMDKWINRWPERWMDGSTDRITYGEWMIGWIAGWRMKLIVGPQMEGIRGRMDVSIGGLNRRTMEGRIPGW